MSYKLYTDKQEIFECNIFLEGASLTKATSRIIVETQDLKLLFEGTIDKDGNCKVPIKKLRGLVSEDDKGTIYESKKTMIPMLKKYSTKTGYTKGAKSFIKEVIQKLSKK